MSETLRKPELGKDFTVVGRCKKVHFSVSYAKHLFDYYQTQIQRYPTVSVYRKIEEVTGVDRNRLYHLMHNERSKSRSNHFLKSTESDKTVDEVKTGLNITLQSFLDALSKTVFGDELEIVVKKKGSA